MKIGPEFGRRADEALHTLYRKLSSVEDDFGFDLAFDSGTLRIELDGGRAPVVVSAQPAAGHIRVSAGANQYRLGWDVVENAFILETTGQTLQELIEETVSELVGDDVSL
jgi:frataxin-like iron-binding protein CyaY